MTQATQNVLDRRSMGELNVVFGSGGSKAVLAGAGATLAFHLAGLKTFRTIGGVSGGSIPAALLASGTDANSVISLALQTDFSRLLTAKRGKLHQLFALLSKYRYETTRPPQGVFSSERLGAFVDERMLEWPANYWTMASTNSGSLLFTAGGVFLNPIGGARQNLVNATPPSVGFAVRASCAIPGIIDAMPYEGEDCFDGALTVEGECPVDLPVTQFGAKKSDVIAIDISEEIIKKRRWLRILWHIFCGGRCASIDAVHPEEKDGLILVAPKIHGFHALEFSLSREQKWHAIAAGFIATIDALERHGRLPADNRDDVLSLRHRLAAVDFKLMQKRGYAKLVESIFAASHPHLLPKLTLTGGGRP